MGRLVAAAPGNPLEIEALEYGSDKTFMARPADVKPQWWVVDATEKVVGRLASDIAMILMGKHRPTYTPHVDTGDYVIVLNADKLVFTGNKWDQKQYTWYTGYMGLRPDGRQTHGPPPRADHLSRRAADAQKQAGL